MTSNPLNLDFITYYNRRPVFSGLFLFFIFSFSQIFGFDYKPKISNIEIIGLSKTKPYIVKREIRQPLNSFLDSSIVELDRNRIFNLGLFDEVSWRLVPLENDYAILQFILIESIHKLPPLILPSYDEEKGWSLRGVFLIKNFQGKNRTIELNGSIGAQKKIQLLFSDPWIFGNHISLLMYVEKNSYKHLFLDRSVDISTIRMELGKWYGEKFKMRFSPAVVGRVYRNDSDTLTYNYFMPNLKLVYDTRDIYWYPRKGMRLINKFAPMLGQNEFFIWDQSYSIYLPIFDSKHNVTLAMNVTSKKKWGYKGDVWLSYFGNTYNIRGWNLPGVIKNNSVSENYRFGHEYILSTIEFRKLIIPKHRSRRGMLNGLCIAAFIDGGIIFNKWSNINEENFMGGAGFGIRIPIPILESIRIDLGWGIRNKKFNNSPVLHFGIQQKF